jgi:perosamine synthetase
MLDQLICKENTTLFQAIKKIDTNAKGILFIIDQNNAMLGTITDGDIRRAILASTDLSEVVQKIMNTNFSCARETDSHEEMAIKISERVRIIPILNDKNQIIDFFQYDKRIHLPISSPSLKGNEFKYLMDAFLSTWISSAGEYIKKFEANFSNYIGSEFGVSTSNGTTAIHLALEALGIGSGDEVIVPDLTFAASINAVIHSNATPVIVDIEKSSWCIDPKEIEKAITVNTKAILVVHLYGQAADMDAILLIAKKYNLKVIEDCAEAHGAKYKGRKIGSFGDINCFSFFANKIITTGEGGMCITNSEDLNKKMRTLRDHGMNPDKKYWHDVVGYNYRMTNLQAAIGVAQLERIDEILHSREHLETTYKNALSNINNLSFQENVTNSKKVVWLVCALIKTKNRDIVIKELQKNKIDGRPFFFPLSEMPLYQPYANMTYNNSVEISKQGINFPTNVEVSESQLSVIKSVLKNYI